DLDRAAERLVERERALVRSLRNSFALQILHDQVVRCVLVADVIQRANMRMAERRDRASFALEPVTKLRISGEGFGENLDRDDAIESRIAGAIDLAHSAHADLRGDFIRAEAGAWGEGHGIFRGLYGRDRGKFCYFESVGTWLRRASAWTAEMSSVGSIGLARWISKPLCNAFARSSERAYAVSAAAGISRTAASSDARSCRINSKP